MPTSTAYTNQDLPEAIGCLKQQLGDRAPRLLMYFASSKYNPTLVAEQIQQAFPSACTAGCTTAGEIVSGKMLTESIVAIALDEDVIDDACFAVITDLDGDVRLDQAFTFFERRFGAPVNRMDITKYVGIVLVDGLSGAEERLMEKIGDRCDLFFVGGAAGDDLNFAQTHVMAGGEAFTNAAVLVLIRPKNGFGIIKTQSFVATGRKLVATEVDEPNRRVISFNNRPAAHAYAEAVGTTLDQLPSHFMKHPIGLLVDGDPYVRSPQRVDGEGVVFYCRIIQGMELEILEATDIVSDTRQAILSYANSHRNVSALIDFHCILRTLELRSANRCNEYGAVYGNIPSIGFSTYGEEYIGHINQTSTILALH